MDEPNLPNLAIAAALFFFVLLFYGIFNNVG